MTVATHNFYNFLKDLKPDTFQEDSWAFRLFLFSRELQRDWQEKKKNITFEASSSVLHQTS